MLIRHALPLRVDPPTAGDPPPADPGLAPRGCDQAVRLAEFLAAEDIEAVYASPVRRAQETATELATALGLEPVTDSGIAEWDVASTSYVPIEELKTAGDPRWQALRLGDFYTSDVDPAVFRQRVVNAVEAIVARHQDGQVALVTHAGPINAYAGHVLGQEKPFWLPLTRSPGYCSITRIAVEPDGTRRVISVNETGHVRELLAP